MPEGVRSFETPEQPKMGISFETPLGEVYKEIDLNFPPEELSVFQAFPDRGDLKEIIQRAKKFKKEHPDTTNGPLLGNPVFESVGDGRMQIAAECLHYYVYFAAHQMRQENPAAFGEKYGALSICGIVYDKAANCFYLSVRPQESQEDGGKIDAPGGVLNPKQFNADPFATANNRFTKKLGLQVEGDQIVCLGVERIFNEEYSLRDLAMFLEVDGQAPTVDAANFATIKLDNVEEMIKSDRLTDPAKATLLLALAQPQFAKFGWGHERIQKLLAEINKPHDHKE